MKFINKKIAKVFLLICIPLLMLWVSFIAYNLNKDKQFEIERISSENEIRDANTAVLVEKYMSEIEENLKVVMDANEFSGYINDENNETYNELVGLFVRVMVNKSDYDQIRYIDNNGQEIIRVDNEEEMKVVQRVAPKEELKNIKNNAYFEDTMDLIPTEVYISSIEMVLENDGNEEYYQPIIRFSMPVFNSKMQRNGILIINYKADYFIDMLKNHGESTYKQTCYVLNSQGSYIQQFNGKMSVNVLNNLTNEKSYKDSNSKRWEIISKNSYGSIIEKEKLITYFDVLKNAKDKNSNYNDQWILVHEFNISNLFSIQSTLQALISDKNLPFFFVILLFSYIISYVLDSLRKKDYQLEITKKIADTTGDAVLITNDKTVITYVNTAYELATGYTAEEVIGKKPDDFKSGKHDSIFYEKMWADIRGKGQWEGMLWDRKKDGMLYPQKLKIIAVKDKNRAKAHHYVGVFSNLLANTKIPETFETFHYSEGQFMLPNEEMMLELLSPNTGDKELRFMVLYIAIENFNQLITSHSDIEFISSEMFINLIKPLIGKDDFVAQTGRSVFVVIINLKNINTSLEEFVKNIHKETTKVMNINGRDLFFKTRIGASFWTEDTFDFKRLLLNSLIALEWTGNHKETEVAFFQDVMIEQFNQENEMEGLLKKAIEKNELYMVYQPQIDIETTKIVGMEALLRWNNDVLGLISPTIFIPIAEKNHLIVDIGNWVIDRVCQDLKYMNTFFETTNESLRCAINISAIQMKQSDFLESFYGIINKYGIDNAQIEIEITESVLLSSELQNINNLKDMQSKGIKIAIDDFGTGYSSLSYLHTLPLDKIKIDRSFIKDYPGENEGKLAKILVDLSKTLQKKVLAEGAETLEQVEYLKSVGCEYVQGFYYSVPLRLNEFVEYVKNERKYKM